MGLSTPLASLGKVSNTSREHESLVSFIKERSKWKKEKTKFSFKCFSLQCKHTMHWKKNSLRTVELSTGRPDVVDGVSHC